LLNGILKILRSGYVSIMLTALLAIILQFIPLTNSLDYEFATVMGLWLFITSGYRISKLEGDFLSILSKNKLKISLLIIIPFLISAGNSILFSICPFRQGIWFYLFITLFSLLLGMMTGYLSALISKKHPKLIFSLFIAGFIFISFLEFYLFPQAFTYNIMFGSFSGTLYDELIEFNPMLIVFRVYNLLLIGGFILLALFLNRRGVTSASKFNKAASSLVLIAFFFASYFLLNLFLGFSMPLFRIENELGGRTETEHFILIYPKDIPAEKMKISALHHEFYYREISEKLGFTPDKKIVSILFNSSEEKKKYIGTSVADISKPWQNIIITNLGNQDLTLKHEIVHAFTSKLGKTIFKMPGNFNPLILEGYASAIENKFSFFDLEYAAGMIKDYRNSIKIGGLIEGMNFFGQNSSIAYAYSGAFVKFLIDKYGVARLNEIYGNPDFNLIYGKNIKELESEFETYLNKQGYSYNKNTEILFFSGKPVFLKKCPRYTAYMMKVAGNYYSSGDYQKSSAIYSELYKDLENSQALMGMINSETKLRKEKDALALLENEIKKFENTNSYFILQINLADLYIRNSLPDKAASLYKLILEEEPHFDYVINVMIKEAILREGNYKLKEYLLGDLNARIKIVTGNPYISKLLKVYWLSAAGMEGKKNLKEMPVDYESFVPKDDLELYMMLGIFTELKNEGDFLNAKKVIDSCIRHGKKSSGFLEIINENRKKIEYLLNFKDKKF